MKPRSGQVRVMVVLLSMICIVTSSEAVGLGPYIQFQEPPESNNVVKGVTPLDVIILFKNNRAPVDAESLKIEIWYLLRWRDIWNESGQEGKWMKAIPGGYKLESTNLPVPTGESDVRISISDQEGRKTVRNYRFVID